MAGRRSGELKKNDRSILQHFAGAREAGEDLDARS
jgi:hypothetical protein